MKLSNQGGIMKADETLQDRLTQQGISRRYFLKFCTAMASLMALPPGTVTTMTAR